MPAHLRLLLSPRASRDALVGRQDEDLKIALRAPPVDGAANTALIKFLAELLGVAKKDISLIAGKSGRRKIVKIESLDEDELARRVAKRLDGLNL